MINLDMLGYRSQVALFVQYMFLLFCLESWRRYFWTCPVILRIGLARPVWPQFFKYQRFLARYRVLWRWLESNECAQNWDLLEHRKLHDWRILELRDGLDGGTGLVAQHILHYVSPRQGVDGGQKNWTRPIVSSSPSKHRTTLNSHQNRISQLQTHTQKQSIHPSIHPPIPLVQPLKTVNLSPASLLHSG